MKNPLWLRGLALRQKIAYVSSFSYWFFPYSRLVNMLAPSMFLLFGVMIYNATAWQYTVYGIPYFLATWIYSDFTYGPVRWPLTSDVYEMVQTPMSAMVLLGTLLRPGKRPFNVTPKGEHLEEEFISSSARIQSAFFAIVALSLAAGVWRWLVHPGERPQLVFTMLWELLNFVIAVATVVVMLERRQGRETYRISAPDHLSALAQTSVGEIPMGVVDLSMSGVRLAYPRPGSGRPVPLDEKITLQIWNARKGEQPVSLPAQVMVHHADGIGAAFQYGTVPEKRALVDLIYGDGQELERLLDRRRRRIGFVQGYVYFLWKTAAGTGYLGSYLVRRAWKRFSGRPVPWLSGFRSPEGLLRAGQQRQRS